MHPVHLGEHPVVHVHRDGGISGSERHLLNLLPSLRVRGVDARLLVLRSTSGPGALERAARDTGVPTAHAPPRAHYDPRTAVDVLRHLRAWRPGIVHTHLIHADVWAGAAAALARVPAITTMHAGRQPHHTSANVIAVKTALRRASAVIAISDHVATFLRDQRLCSPSAVHVVKYGLPRLGPPEALSGAPVAVAASRLIPGKGHAVLLRAWRHVVDAVPDAQLLIAGDGPLREDLQTLARALGLGEQVRFLGFQSDVAALYRRAAVVVFPTEAGFDEGFGLVNLEAMQHGRPVVASRKDSMPEIIEDGITGILVEPGDVTELADALQRLTTEPRLAAAMGAAGWHRAESHFSLESMAASTIAVYEAVLTERA